MNYSQTRETSEVSRIDCKHEDHGKIFELFERVCLEMHSYDLLHK